jgi:hypothetical protein
MRYLRILLEAAIMAGGLMLVIITLSGQTRDIATGISVASVIMFILSQILSTGED